MQGMKTRFESDAESLEVGVPFEGAFHRGPESPEVRAWSGELPVQQKVSPTGTSSKSLFTLLAQLNQIRSMGWSLCRQDGVSREEGQ